METLTDIAAEQARRHGVKVALCFEGRSATFAELEEMSSRGASALLANGVRRGSRVAMLSKNSDTFFELLIACASASAMLLPLNWRLAIPEIAYILRDASPDVVIVEDRFVAKLREAVAIAGVSPLLVRAEGGEELTYRDMRAKYEPLPRAVLDPEDPVLLLYTSGTTGAPKGAMLPHRALVKMRELEAQQGPPWLQWSPADVCLVSMPLFHIAGIRTAICGLYNGCTVKVLPEFDAGEVLAAIRAGGITKLFLVPAAMQALARHPDAPNTDFSGLKYIIYGGSPISLPLLEECIAAFGCGFVQAYGSTETAGGVVTLGPDDHRGPQREKMGAAGKPCPGVEIRIVDGAGRSCSAGETGEVQVRGPTTMLGYWRLPEATQEVLDGSGWLRTGDLGFIDREGYLHLRDRLKDMIITGGENVYPIEVESALASHPAVAEVAVVGLPSDRWGEEVSAFVVLRPGATAGAESLIGWVRERIAAYKAPKTVVFVQALPRNAGGKVLKRDLRALAAAPAASPAVAIATEAAR